MFIIQNKKSPENEFRAFADIFFREN